MSKEAAQPTPMMQRYLEVKRQNPGSLLLFRMGDFYELFFEDAEIASKALGLTLTSRDKASSNPIPMAGFPYHQLDNYLQKLIHAGFRAAICDQVEDPKKAKGLVKREVTRVVTPGTITDDALLDPQRSNYLACVYAPVGRIGNPSYDGKIGLAWLELSDGRFLATDVPPSQLADELARIHPAECLIPDEDRPNPHTIGISTANGMVLTTRPIWNFIPTETRRTLKEHFGTATLEGFGIDEASPGVTAAGALLEYVRETQKSALGHISRISPYDRGKTLLIDEATRRSLELTQTIRDGKREGSLLGVMDETVTPMGSRMLAEWLADPLTDAAAIEQRLDAVEELVRDATLCDGVREQLRPSYDMRRLTARVATGRCSPRDLSSLSATLALLPTLKAKLAGRKSQRLQELEAGLDLCPEVRADVETALVDDPPLQITDGGIIRDGYHAELDELRELARGGKAWIAKYQAAESQRTGIPNLKVGFNKVFGYYLEVTAAHAGKVPDNYTRKQTLKNQERYITPELKEYEEKVLGAEERAVALEQELFQSLRDRVNRECARLQATAAVLAEVDVLAALATLAVRRRYCRPEITTDPLLDLRESRHPVLDALQPSGEFVPNDVLLNCGLRIADCGLENATKAEGGRRKAEDTASGSGAHSHDESAIRNPQSAIQLITGPNMAGKSTYIRQAALITLMAQMGSFVPASEARVGIADRIFARVGASDELSRGQSTFMVEMTETARILNSATPRSLVILDEIGRGTSTYDGISLAWAVTEYLHDVVGCRTLFATHYHELTELAQTLPGVSNWNVAVREDRDGVIFLHRIVEGAADKSYGIHVARLAGVPGTVIERAKVILETLEADHLDEKGRPKVPARSTRQSGDRQLSLFGGEPHPVLEQLRALDVDQLTPLAALQELNRIREELRRSNHPG
jgi:DNA mismatch repair protein MutS